MFKVHDTIVNCIKHFCDIIAIICLHINLKLCIKSLCTCTHTFFKSSYFIVETETYANTKMDGDMYICTVLYPWKGWGGGGVMTFKWQVFCEKSTPSSGKSTLPIFILCSRKHRTLSKNFNCRDNQFLFFPRFCLLFNTNV
jgi:hypothetical protein